MSENVVRKPVSFYSEDIAAIEQVQERADLPFSTAVRVIIREWRETLLSPLSVAMLTQVAKGQGLDNLDAAVEFLARNLRPQDDAIVIAEAEASVGSNGDLRRLIQAYQEGQATAREVADRLVIEEHRKRPVHSVE